ncbi:MAG: hypothetical protein Unbinned3972contig1001_31 [Prokaryotic dsDNA virus sp.]|nr:MAG: hypothetical protein Unbinned3972contig1001_31 [Prokaryotic dsDNA virus sp.]|tara:strand:- start:8989 stop:9402 length:414 start_codon:yes stop_codon:yes gene_type:complete
MSKVKARSVGPQYISDSLGSIWATPKTKILSGSIVAVTGTTSNTFLIESASNQSIRRSSGLMYVLKHTAMGGQRIVASTTLILPYMGEKKVKDGDAIWLGRDGVWTLNKPKTRPIQVGRILGSGDSAQVLLAPQGRY